MSNNINPPVQEQGGAQEGPVSHRFIDRFLEYSLVLTLAGIPFVLFYTSRLKSMFDHVSILLFVVWFVILRGRTQRTLPKYLIITVLLYAASFLISAGLSDHKQNQLPEINSLRVPFIAGLLYIMPFSRKSRKLLMSVFLAIAASLGVVAFLQYFGIFYPQMQRPEGIVNMPGMYAGMLSFACGSAAIMLLVPGNWPFRTWYERAYLAAVLFCTGVGIVLYMARGLWIAFIIAMVITLVLYNRRKAIIITVAVLLLFAVILSASSRLRERAVSIVTSLYTEEVPGSTGIRIELWKAAWMISFQSPVFGTGLWDYQSDVQQLIKEEKIKNVPVTFHAHNLYLHNLATRGMVGFLATTGFLAALLFWGAAQIRTDGGEGGYIIIFSTLIIVFGGITEVSFADGAPYAFTYWYTIGLFGPGYNGQKQVNTAGPGRKFD